MVRALFFLIPLGLAIYAVVDCIQTDESEVRNLPRFVWILIILLFWIVGPVAWLVAGRPERGAAGSRGAQPPATRMSGSPEYERPRPLAPDDDPEFLSQLQRSNTEHERMLKKWEDDLRRREEDLRRRKDDSDSAGQDERDN